MGLGKCEAIRQNLLRSHGRPHRTGACGGRRGATYTERRPGAKKLLFYERIAPISGGKLRQEISDARQTSLRSVGREHRAHCIDRRPHQPFMQHGKVVLVAAGDLI